MELLKVENLQKYYPKKKALDNVSFTVNQGEIVALIGRNGAGKTTLMNSIVSISYPTGGAVYYKGENLLDDRRGLHEFGILINATFFDYLSVYDNLWLLMEASGATDKRSMRNTIMETLRLVGLEGQARQKVKSFSFGMKQRLGLAQTLLVPIGFLILDEPFVGLDPAGKELLKSVIVQKARRDKCGILFSSHDLDDVSEICDRIVMLANGRKVYDGIFREEKQYMVELDCESVKICEELLTDFEGQIAISGNKVTFNSRNLIQPVLQRLIQGGASISDLQVHENSLYDLFKQEA
jgi:ABC-2 type transport system ATP-binding protein